MSSMHTTTGSRMPSEGAGMRLLTAAPEFGGVQMLKIVKNARSKNNSIS